VYLTNAKTIQVGIDPAPRHWASQATAFVQGQINADKVSEHLPLQAKPVRNPPVAAGLVHQQLFRSKIKSNSYLSFFFSLGLSFDLFSSFTLPGRQLPVTFNWEDSSPGARTDVSQSRWSQLGI